MNKADIIKPGPPGDNVFIAANIQMLLFSGGCYHPVFYGNTPCGDFSKIFTSANIRDTAFSFLRSGNVLISIPDFR